MLFAIGGVTAYSQQSTFRHYFAYGDSQLVQLARQSGADPLAAIGREIPTTNLLRVPTGEEFTVQYHFAYLSGPRSQVHGAYNAVNFSFDRAFWDTSATRNPSIVLDSSSYRKLAPAVWIENRLHENFVNGQNMKAWDTPTIPIDFDGDGLPDDAQYAAGGTSIAGVQTGNSSAYVRPVGLSCPISGFDPRYGVAGTLFDRGQSVHLMDVKWRNALSVGEQYGSQDQETGLSIHASQGRPSPTWTSSHLVQNPQYYGNDPDWVNIGAKYNLIGAAPVPEPASALALGLAALALLRRRKR